MLGSTMAVAGNETLRFPVQGQPRSPLASARPLKSSPLAGPAVIVSLIDGTLSSTPAPARPRYPHAQQHDQHDLPARPKSVHHALTHRSRSISAQSPSRPVSLYAYCPPGPGVANGNGRGNSGSNGYGIAHESTSTSGNPQHTGSGGGTSSNANANANNFRRKRPSTAPGPRSKSGFDSILTAKEEEGKQQQQQEEEIEEMDISESYSSYTDGYPVSTSTPCDAPEPEAQAQPQAQAPYQTLHQPDTNSRVIRYSPDATSTAGPVGGSGVGISSLAGPTSGGGGGVSTSNPNPRPPSILLTVDHTQSQSQLQPKPILKHHTSFVLSPPSSSSSSSSSFASGSGSSLPSLSSSSSRSSFLSTHSASAGDIPSLNLGPRSSSSSSLRSLPSRSQSQTQLRSRSRLSIVSNVSVELIKEEETPTPDLPPSARQRRPSQTQNAGATQAQTTTPKPDSWYTFSPYATTPRFSRLGLAGSGVVMPVPKREMERVLSKRASVVGPAGGTGGHNREKEGGAGLSRANTSASTRSTSSRMSISSTTSRMSVSSRMSRMSRSGSPPPPIPPIPTGVKAPTPAPTQDAAAAAVPTGGQERLGTSSSSSSPSSSSSSVQSTNGVKSGDSTSVSSVSLSNAGAKGEVAVNVDVEGKMGAGAGADDTNRDADAKDAGENDTNECKKGHKKNRKSLSETFSGSLRSWRSLKSLRSSAGVVHDVPVPVPALPTSINHSSPAVSGAVSVPDLHEVGVRQTPSLALAAGISVAVHGSSLDVSATRPITPKPTLKKRKSASALLARVKSWRKKREESSGVGAGMGEGLGEAVDALKSEDALTDAGAVKDDNANGGEQVDGQASLVVVAVAIAGDDVSESISDPEKGGGGVVVEPSLESGEKQEVGQEVKSEDEDRRDDPEHSDVPAIVVNVVDEDDESDVDEDEDVVLIQRVGKVDLEPTDEESSKTAVEGESDSSSSSESEYPDSTSTPSSMYSLSSFVPMCIPIPSPNLHVSSSVSSPSSLSAGVPAFVRKQLLSLSTEASNIDQDDPVRSVDPPNPIQERPSSDSPPIEESTLISGPGLSAISVKDQGCSEVDGDGETEEYADAEEGEEKEEEREGEGVLTNLNVTETVCHSDRGSCVDVHPIIVPSKDDETRDGSANSSILEEKEDDTNDTLFLEIPRSLTPPTFDSNSISESTGSAPPSIIANVVLTHPKSTNLAPVPPQASLYASESVINPIPPLDVSSSKANTSTSPNPIASRSSHSLTSTSTSRGRSQSRNGSKGRSGSVKRIWKTFICGASHAEQMAVEEAWAEIREREQQEGVLQVGNETEKEKEKSNNAVVLVVAVEPSHDAPEVATPAHASVVTA